LLTIPTTTLFTTIELLLKFPFNYILATVFTALLLVFSFINNVSSAVLNLLLLVTSIILPIIAIFFDTNHHTLVGTISFIIIVNAVLCFSIRIIEVSKNMKSSNNNLKNKNNNNIGINGNKKETTQKKIKASLMCLYSAILTLFWTIICTFVDHHNIDVNLAVPFSSLIFICIRKEMSFNSFHPIVYSAITSVTWWVLLAIYLIFFKGFYILKNNHYDILEGFEHSYSFSFFSDQNISIWEAESRNHSLFISFINLFLLIIPLPGIILGFLRRKNESEEVMFVLSILSILGVIGAKVNSIRYVGVLGVVIAGWRCYDIGVMNKKNNRII
jgi:hypothetical protein